MKVFKFGGASVKDADGVRNIAHVLNTAGYAQTFMVISAMGKTTNALEEVVREYFDQGDYAHKISVIEAQHIEISKQLFQDSSSIEQDIHLFFEDLKSFLRRNKSPNYDFVYDQVVCCGELISTKIVSAYLNSISIQNTWIDVRDYLKTDESYREGQVDWLSTEANFKNLEPSKFYITQGFLGSDPNYFTTTLGREGSDYTAAIIAYCVDAESMTIWKDVPGVLNADPRYFDDTTLLNKISYEEAIELAYYGASVIHPKTMQPLKSKSIPFFVKSFIDPNAAGTQITTGQAIDPSVTCYIVKKSQHLLSLKTKDFSFITEDKISEVFQLLHKFKIKVNLLQNTAISLSLCLEDKYNQLDHFIDLLKENYQAELINEVSLYTLRHFDEKSTYSFTKGKELLRQNIKNTLQIIVKE